VLKAMGIKRERIDSALRISFCKHNTIEEIDAFFEILKAAKKEIKT
jgi:cysteine sulfinate desulfinase/cysteine desulfurase-like protein